MGRAVLSIVCLLACCSAVLAQTLDEGLDSFASQIVADMSEGKKGKLAVVEFSNLDGEVTTLGKLVSEELITLLFLTKKFDVVERHLLNRVLEENKLQVEGLVDPETAKELGRILGVDTICSGTVALVGGMIRLNGRLIDTTTGAIFGVASSRIASSEDLELLLVKSEKKTGSEKTHNSGVATRAAPTAVPVKDPTATLTYINQNKFPNLVKCMRAEGKGYRDVYKEIRVNPGEATDFPVNHDDIWVLQIRYLGDKPNGNRGRIHHRISWDIKHVTVTNRAGEGLRSDCVQCKIW